jgi:DNA-directed RNA polymerase specialized sigma24 family protein
MPGDAEASLPHAYREALRLEAEGRGDRDIAQALGITVEAVPALLVLARRKRARAASDGDEL